MLERERHEGKETTYETLGWVTCTFICDHLNVDELKKFAESALETPRHRLMLRKLKSHAFKLPLQGEITYSFYKYAIKRLLPFSSWWKKTSASSRYLHVILSIQHPQWAFWRGSSFYTVRVFASTCHQLRATHLINTSIVKYWAIPRPAN